LWLAAAVQTKNPRPLPAVGFCRNLLQARQVPAAWPSAPTAVTPKALWARPSWYASWPVLLAVTWVLGVGFFAIRLVGQHLLKLARELANKLPTRGIILRVESEKEVMVDLGRKDEARHAAREALKLGITEIHIVGGLHPSLPYSYYLDMLRALKALDPRLQLKCFTAIEILHLAWLAKKPFREVLTELKAAGLDSLTGGGAEIFRKEIRDRIAKGKESAEEYLDVHRVWHQLGGRSTCTMLYGHLESVADRVDHLARLRALQDETGGFTGFIPLPYHPENNGIPVTTPPTGFDTLRTVAISRMFLDNFGHITAYWVGMGLKLAQVALSYGADDLHGTIVEEHIFHMAGAQTPQLQTVDDMIRAIREAGRDPFQRDTFYEAVQPQMPQLIGEKAVYEPWKQM